MFLATRVVMMATLAVSLAAQSIDPAANTEETASDPNVNSRYTIESINFIDHRDYKLSPHSQEEIRSLTGARLSSEALDRLTARLRDELRAHDVTFRLTRGEQPDSVRVLIHVDHAGGAIDASIPTLSYNSQFGVTGTAQLSSAIGPNTFSIRMVRDVDTLIERYTGMQASYERSVAPNVRIGFEFDGYANEYDPSTLIALNDSRPSSLGAGAYGSRLNYEPSATFVIAEPLTYTVGMSFEQLNGRPGGARSQVANALVNILRFHEHWSGSDGNAQDLDAGYSLRATTALLGSDLPYTRHVAHVKYNYTSRTQSLQVIMLAGAIYGTAPLFERFALGDSSLLRGWNKYELDPLGGNRLAYGSVTYGYRMLRVFYDAGSVWDQGKTSGMKDSAGVGVSSNLGVLQKGAFLLALAFPLRQGRITPVVIAGMNF
ncbi:MAG TPA: BamA/TamA family outer membrane protein [Bryobacteraceae bacterium]|nr:BamA/TamA family outer membrane protein [Bryobacteraceae bacterium]